MISFDEDNENIISAIDISNRTWIVDNEGDGDFNNIQLSKFISDKQVSCSPFVNLATEGFNGSSTIDDFSIMMQLIYLYFTQGLLISLVCGVTLITIGGFLLMEPHLLRDESLKFKEYVIYGPAFAHAFYDYAFLVL